MLQQSNNIVILSKVRNNGVRGTNVKYEYSETVNDEVFNYHTQRSTISLENKVTTVFKCAVPTSGDDNGKFFQKPLEEQVGNSVRNTIIHEFSHNYLLDEYSNLVGNLSDQKHDIKRNNILAKVKESNIQVGKELETSSHFIDGNKIRWRWPRVKKVGLGEISKENDNIDVTNSGNSYTCSVKTNVLKANDTKLGFDKTDKILLRKRFLFDSSVDDYIVGELLPMYA